MNFSNYANYLDSLREKALLVGHRQVVVISGGEHWYQPILENYFQLEQKRTDKALVFNATGIDPDSVNNKNYKHHLGTENHLAIFHLGYDIHADALAALAGTVVAGGLFIIVTPEFSKGSDNALYQRLLAIVASEPCIVQLNQNTNVDSCSDTPCLKGSSLTKRSTATDKFAYSCITNEQALAVEGILKVVSGHRDRPLVITADRGRGKSTALAIASVELLKAGNKHICITAPHPQSLNVFFNYLKLALPEGTLQGHRFEYKLSVIEFIPIDQLLSQQKKCHLLLVDEAAGLPVPLLTGLLKNYRRLVFSSTVHGYEGAGRGFTIKFQQVLNHEKPKWFSLHINEPIRWASDDPLERILNRALLLSSRLTDIEVTEFSQEKATVSYRQVSQAELAENEALLEQVTALLVTAHYQTKPSDLKMLLDDESVSLIVAEKGSQLVGIALLLSEGNIAASLQEKIVKGERRLKGHLLPQSLVSQAGVEQALNASFLRIVRIAIHPQIQAKGIGSQLLNHIKIFAKSQSTDFVGSSFGSNSQLLNFWLTNQFSLIRIGLSKDAASGEHSAIVLAPISEQARFLHRQISRDFAKDFEYLVCQELASLEPQLVALAIQNLKNEQHSQIALKDIEAVSAFVNNHRLYGYCSPALQRFLLHQIYHGRVSRELSSETIYKLAIRKVLQGHSWQELAQEFSLSGQKQIIEQIKQFYRQQLSLKP